MEHSDILSQSKTRKDIPHSAVGSGSGSFTQGAGGGGAVHRRRRL